MFRTASADGAVIVLWGNGRAYRDPDTQGFCLTGRSVSKAQRGAEPSNNGKAVPDIVSNCIAQAKYRIDLSHSARAKSGIDDQRRVRQSAQHR